MWFRVALDGDNRKKKIKALQSRALYINFVKIFLVKHCRMILQSYSC